MRIAKTDVIAGLPAAAARDVMKVFGRRELPADFAGDVLARHGIPTPADAVVQALAGAGYLTVANEYHGVQWTTTVQGNALGMASFGKPIARKTADRLLAELIQRARDYNADPGKPMFVRSLTIFGSYLDEAVDPLGDLDVGLSHGSRITDSAVLRRYSKASGRTFKSYIDELFWPQQELFLFLKNRSAAINITIEDLSAITDLTRVVYSIDEDPGAGAPRATN
ncbi:hypothetical protein [Pseudarthrobacter sp. ATCC 49987]|uniref:hypothetical protein n=1 Tax=Pseudarthrobacter sp. ATCC 49987 TaxID=2698204 RepID=UPI00192465C4|nr:hypothetical protein [Pseudarthrobacter sp. ATCC 49987]